MTLPLGWQTAVAETINAMEAEPAKTRLLIEEFPVVLDRVRNAPRREWLIAGLWPGGAHGALGAAEKTGKTWAAMDLACSIATGSPWFNHFECRAPGQVLLFSGEGGENVIVRQLDAIMRSRGGEVEELAGMLRLSRTLPRLDDKAALAEVRSELEAHPAELTILDPLYMAARGAKGSDLYAMGDLLYGIQEICQEAKTALLVVPHWNKTGEGTGADRFTGTGIQQWGRVLGSASVERRAKDPDGASNVLLKWEFMGSEIADFSFRCRRRVWAADPGDLNSELSYEVEVTQAGESYASDADMGLSVRPNQRRVLAALEAGGDQRVKDVQDRVANDGQGPPLTTRTIQRLLGELETLGMVQGTASLAGFERYWSVVSDNPQQGV